MDPADYYQAKQGKTKASAFIGKGGLTAVGEEPVVRKQPVKQSKAE
jgi:hypothetical protein